MRVIAIDGPAGSGKSTIGRALAERLGLTYLDTGAMYRAVAFVALEHDLDVHDEASVAGAARAMELQWDDGRLLVNGVDATAEIRGAAVSAVVSTVAALPSVREELRLRQRAWAEAHDGGVVEGRDIGSVVFPDATLKVYLTASEDERAARRARQIGAADTEAVAAAIAARDRADSTRAESPLVEPDGAVTIDSTGLGITEVVDLIARLVEQRGS